jgi:hypothetical protein
MTSTIWVSYKVGFQSFISAVIIAMSVGPTITEMDLDFCIVS